MVVCIILLALGAISLTLFLIEKIRRYSLKETIIKACTSMLFIALAAFCFYHNGFHPFGVYVLCGLVMGLIGDVCLDLKYVIKERSRFYTYAGFVSFAIGHIFYITGMFVCFNNGLKWFAYVIPFVLGFIGGVLVLLLEKPLKMKYGEYKFICWLYGSILFSMTFTTITLAVNQQMQTVTFNMLCIGGILFAISDLILSGTYFGEGKERPVDLISNAVTYYAAQYLIAFSLFFLFI